MIKTFEFEVSNAASSPIGDDDKSTAWYNRKIAMLKHPEDIDNCINSWIKKNHPFIEDIKIVPVDVDYHNNGRGNKIHLFYTIIYR